MYPSRQLGSHDLAGDNVCVCECVCVCVCGCVGAWVCAAPMPSSPHHHHHYRHHLPQPKPHRHHLPQTQPQHHHTTTACPTHLPWPSSQGGMTITSFCQAILPRIRSGTSEYLSMVGGASRQVSGRLGKGLCASGSGSGSDDRSGWWIASKAYAFMHEGRWCAAAGEEACTSCAHTGQ